MLGHFVADLRKTSFLRFLDASTCVFEPYVAQPVLPLQDLVKNHRRTALTTSVVSERQNRLARYATGQVQGDTMRREVGYRSPNLGRDADDDPRLYS